MGGSSSVVELWTCWLLAVVLSQQGIHALSQVQHSALKAKNSGRSLMQLTTPRAALPLVQTPLPQPSLSTPGLAPGLTLPPVQPGNAEVVFIQNQGLPDACLDACSHGYTCGWQNAWIWLCHSTNIVDHMWIYEPGGLIRLAANDSLARYPEICLDMCETHSAGTGACGLVQASEALNVGWQECTGRSNQVWQRQGNSIINSANGHCLSVLTTQCGNMAVCNRHALQTGVPGTMWNVVGQPCDTSNANQSWMLVPQAYQPIPGFTSLTISASKYQAVDGSIAQQVALHSPQVVTLQSAEPGSMCLAVENMVSCQSTTSPGLPVCAWGNVLLQPCALPIDVAISDQQWVYDSITHYVMATGTDSGLEANLCLTLCTDQNPANRACSLVENNVGWQDCTGAASQQWQIQDDGTIASLDSETCLSTEPLCVVSTRFLTSNITARSLTVDGVPLSSCILDSLDSAWSQIPYDGTSSTVPGILNVIGIPCAANDSNSLQPLHFSMAAVQGATISSGSATLGALRQGGNGHHLAAVVAGSVTGGLAAALLCAAAIMVVMVRRRRHSQKGSMGMLSISDVLRRKEDASSINLQHAASRQLDSLSHQLLSIDSDVLPSSDGGASSRESSWLNRAPRPGPKQSIWSMDPQRLKICRNADGTPVLLGSGAYGKVYKAMQDDVSVVAVKILHACNASNVGQAAAFWQEIELLGELRHRNVLQLYGAAISGMDSILVTEYMEQGDLYGALGKQTGRHCAGLLSWHRRGKDIACDIARGVYALHVGSIIHFDLKSPNVLLSKDLVAKLADVGLAKQAIASHTHESKPDQTRGTWAWQAPETILGKHASFPSDIWSFGVILHELFTGEIPKRGCMRPPRVPEETSIEAVALMQECLHHDPGMRPTAKSIITRLETMTGTTER